jgi:hypothetical protein
MFNSCSFVLLISDEAKHMLDTAMPQLTHIWIILATAEAAAYVSIE